MVLAKRFCRSHSVGVGPAFRRLSLATILIGAVLPTAPAGAANPWKCAPASDLPTLVLAYTGFTLNNFNISEDVGTFSGRPYIELSLSAVNRRSEAVFVTVQFVALDADRNPIFVISAEPDFDIVSKNSNEAMKASVNAVAGELAAMNSFCIRADGDFS